MFDYTTELPFGKFYTLKSYLRKCLFLVTRSYGAFFVQYDSMYLIYYIEECAL